MTSRSEGLTVVPSPDGLAEARRIRAEWEQLGPLPIYDEQQLGDVASFDATVELACRRMRLRKQALDLVERRLAAAMLAAAGDRTVTAADFRRHAERFGPELVTETAQAMGVSLARRRSKPKTIKRQRRSNGALRKQVLDLHRRGVVVPAIADTLNIADRRVKQIVTEASGSPSGEPDAKPHELPHEHWVCGTLNRPVGSSPILAGLAAAA